MEHHPTREKKWSDVEQEVHDIAIFDDVIFAFGTHFTGFFRALFAFVSDEIVISDGLRADKAFFEIGVDFTRRLRGGGTDRNGPGAHFFHASGEIRLQVQQRVTGADHAVQPRLFEAQLLHKLIALFIVKLSDIRFHGGAHRHNHRAFFRGDFTHLIQERVVLETVFVDVRDVHGRLERQETQVFDEIFLFFAQIQRAQHTGVLKLRQAFFQYGQLGFGVFIAAFGFLGDTMNRTLAGIEVRKRQLGIDGINIFRRVYFARDVDDVVVFKATHHVADSFGFADVGQELVAQAFTFGRALHQTGDIHKFHRGRQNTLRLHDLGDFVQTRIGHRHDAGVRLNGTEREVRRLNTCFGQRIEQSGFTDVRQADDTAFESHGLHYLNCLFIRGLKLTR
ncbi:hypothetical protein ESA_01487 [Cronobacter sakazakii ATCC BAA-894]|uniref:Uncharacterized protein n=1 Tax=Cronobacter sakazakii (strain ATCC BAA-894) TaxID=290339 RepID=A7MNJ8_CROS8|nr:hypothetical protein ESA_01487 [Cronobacter sakazakii ATCC BAA-894]